MRILGHPIHPMLVHFPIAFWTVAAAAYVGELVGVPALPEGLALTANVAGLVTAIAAMAAGFVELVAIDSKSPAMPVATRHMMAMLAAWLCFLVAALLPRFDVFGDGTLRLAIAAAAVLGLLLMAAGGFLGGRLVYRYRVGASDR
jgi:uncharacterized membrane protein